MAIRTGIYAIEFINDYSWFTPKDVRFRVNVLDSINIYDPFNQPIRNILFNSIDDEGAEIQINYSLNHKNPHQNHLLNRKSYGNEKTNESGIKSPK